MDDIKIIPKGYNYPWRRYFARMLDISLYSVISTLFFMFVLNISVLNDLSTFINIAISSIIMILVEPFLLSKYRTTFGKKMLGIKVYHESLRNLTYKEGFYRVILVFIKGLGLQISFVPLITLILSYRKLTKEGGMSWDYDIYYEVEEYTGKMTFLYLIFEILFFGIVIFSAFFQAKPPYKEPKNMYEF